HLVKLPVGLRTAFISHDHGCESQLSIETMPSTSVRPRLPIHRPELEKEPSVANIKSQMKRILTNKKATDRNKAVKSELRTAVRATRKAVVAGDKDQAAAALIVASKKLDKA